MLSSTDLTTSIVFIDAGVEGYEQLYANVNPSIQPHILNPYEDGIQQITNVLSGYMSTSRTLNLYLVAHGSPGSVSLGNTVLSLSSLAFYQRHLQNWFAHRPSPSNLFLYACNVAAGDAGDELIHKLHHITGATIHGSKTKVGNAALGGNWELNAIAYSIQDAYNHPLALDTQVAPFSEVALETYAGVLPDTDGDLIDDADDLDDDNDGIPDEVEGPAPTDSGKDGSYAANEVSFGITGTVLDSIEIGGTVYTDLTTPDTYTSSFTNPSDTSEIYVINNGTTETDFGASGANWDTDAITPFTSRDLNYYQGIDTRVSGQDYFELGYDVPVITTNGMFVAFTERNSNNPVELQAYDENGTALGDPISVVRANYIPMGINVTYGNNQTQPLGVAIYPLDDLAPVGSAIASIRVIPTADPGDAADGKVFIFGNNTLQTSLDTDGDGIPNRIDLDSDNDGISDLVESGQNAAVVDENNDGIRDDIADNPATGDGDGDGLADAVDGANTITVAPDFDTDGIPDYLDLDADNDGIPDVIEAQPTVGYTSNGTANTDQDQDGVLDAFDQPGAIFGGQFAPPENTDGQDLPDYLDTDSDNDGLNDIDESGLTLLNADDNNDGIDDGVNASYVDPDGLVNVPLTTLTNTDLDDRDADYRSLDVVPTLVPPTANDDTLTAPVGTPVTINPLLNDSDADGTLDPTTVLFEPAPGSTLSADGKTLTVPGQGIWTINPTTGLISFTPNSGFTGTPTPVAYTVKDNEGLRSNAGTVTINYTNSSNDILPPVAADDSFTVSVGAEGIINPLANDSDADGTLDAATVTFVGLETPIPGSTLSTNGKTLTVPNEGTWSIAPVTGVISFIPNAGFTGDPTSIQYTVKDDDGLSSNVATIRLTYTTVGGEQIGSSNRILKSLSDPDAIVGDNSNDILNGGSQKDVIKGEKGDDVINGGTNSDRLFGGQGSDLVNGGSGNDLLRGNAGNDMLNGGDGNDRVFGGRGKDTLTGSNGNDKLYGQQKRDTMDGGSGNDLMVGGRGRDTMTGGEGRDQFRYLSTKEFRDVITDFSILQDKMDVRKIQPIGSIDNLNFIQKGNDALVQGWTGQTFKTIARLEAIDINDLNESNFRF